MQATDWTTEIALLRASGASLEPGLSEAEFAAAEAHYRFRFPSDLRELLAVTVPSGNFPNWRALGSPELESMISWPLRGIQFEIEHNVFWWPAWGQRPTDVNEAFAVAETQIAAVPFLIPLYSHRYLPAEPAGAGNPVLSVYQTDIIYYGADLRAYIGNEFGKRRNLPDTGDVKRIRFWSEVIASMHKLPNET